MCAPAVFPYKVYCENNCTRFCTSRYLVKCEAVQKKIGYLVE
ncbi:hypothetical protein HMPREF1145_2019 [Oribacterium parvum ACB8]|nr:hypothetical protein HMPREF1145_2019 [Oribacterium parvum ACB8]